MKTKPSLNNKFLSELKINQLIQLLNIHDFENKLAQHIKVLIHFVCKLIQTYDYKYFSEGPSIQKEIKEIDSLSNKIAALINAIESAHPFTKALIGMNLTKNLALVEYLRLIDPKVDRNQLSDMLYNYKDTGLRGKLAYGIEEIFTRLLNEYTEALNTRKFELQNLQQSTKTSQGRPKEDFRKYFISRLCVIFDFCNKWKNQSPYIKITQSSRLKFVRLGLTALRDEMGASIYIPVGKIFDNLLPKYYTIPEGLSDDQIIYILSPDFFAILNPYSENIRWFQNIT